MCRWTTALCSTVFYIHVYIYTYIYVASSVLLPPSHPRPPCMTQPMTARSDQVSTISDISPLFGKTSHHSGHYSFTALKLSQSWIPCCPLRPVDGAEMVQPHTAEIFVFKLCRITIFDSGISVKEVRSEVPADTEELCCPGTYQHLWMDLEGEVVSSVLVWDGGGMCELLDAGMGPVLVYKYLSTILVEVKTLPRELGKSEFVHLLIW